MLCVTTEILNRKSPYTDSLSCEPLQRRVCLVENQGVITNFVTWDSKNTSYEASSILELKFAASTCCRTVLQQDPSNEIVDDDPMELAILEALYGQIQDWKMFIGTPIVSASDLSPLQLSIPVLHKYPPGTGQLSQPENDKLLSCRSRLTLRFSCFAKQGPGSLKSVKQSTIPVGPMATYDLSLKTSILIMEYSTTNLYNDVEPRFIGSAAESSRYLQTVLDEIWKDEDDQLTAWAQLYLLACVRTYFAQCWKETREEWRRIDEVTQYGLEKL
jgi:hypothetical protein